MINLPETVALPMKADEDGNIRISGTRVTLHSIISAYKLGDSPEAIQEGFPTVPLADVYAVISYYLAHREIVDEHMRQIDEEGQHIRQEWEARYTPEQKARTEHFRKLLAEKRELQELVMRFAADENFNGHLLAGLRARLPDVDIVRVQDTEMYEAADPDLLAWLAQENRILLSHDVQTMPGYVYERVRATLPMPGLVIVQETIARGKLLDELEVVLGAGRPEDFENVIRYIPMG